MKSKKKSKKNYQCHSDPCTACGTFTAQRCFHHIYTRKSRPDLEGEIWNQIPLCSTHHNEVHQKGLVFLAEQFKSVQNWLEGAGWDFNDFIGKWEHYKASKN